MSTTSRIDGSGGKIHSFCAMYSLRMSVWIVPRSSVARHALLLADADVEREQHRRRRVDRHRGRDLAERDPAEERLHVGERVDRDALAADLAERPRVVGVVAHQRRHVEGRREAGLAVLEQVAEALVRLLGRAEAGELAHRPELPAVHRRVDAARERVHAGVAEVALVVDVDVVRASTAARSRARRWSRRARPAARAWRRRAPSRQASWPVERAIGPRSSPSRNSTGARLAGLPEDLLAARVRGAREDEQQVGEPVQVDEDERVQLDLFAGRERVALGAAADGAGDVETRRRLGAARAARSSSARAASALKRVAVVLERVDLRPGSRAAGRRPRRTGRERSAPTSKSSFCTRSSTARASASRSPASASPIARVQLVDGRRRRAIRQSSFGRARAVAEARLARCRRRACRSASGERARRACGAHLVDYGDDPTRDGGGRRGGQPRVRRRARRDDLPAADRRRASPVARRVVHRPRGDLGSPRRRAALLGISGVHERRARRTSNVAPDAQNQGIGSALLEHAKAESPDGGSTCGSSRRTRARGASTSGTGSGSSSSRTASGQHGARARRAIRVDVRSASRRALDLARSSSERAELARLGPSGAAGGRMRLLRGSRTRPSSSIRFCRPARRTSSFRTSTATSSAAGCRSVVLQTSAWHARSSPFLRERYGAEERISGRDRGAFDRGRTGAAARVLHPAAPRARRGRGLRGRRRRRPGARCHHRRLSTAPRSISPWNRSWSCPSSVCSSRTASPCSRTGSTRCG